MWFPPPPVLGVCTCCELPHKQEATHLKNINAKKQSKNNSIPVYLHYWFLSFFLKMSNPRNNNMSYSAKLPSLESWQRKERRDERGWGIIIIIITWQRLKRMRKRMLHDSAGLQEAAYVVSLLPWQKLQSLARLPFNSLKTLWETRETRETREEGF